MKLYQVILGICLIIPVFGYTFSEESFANYYLENGKDIPEVQPLVDVERNEVSFRLFTRDNINSHLEIFYGELSDVSIIRKTKPFKFITHGYINHANDTWILDIKNRYLKKDDVNVILVDWAGAASSLYPLSAMYTKQVGYYIGDLIIDLNQTLNVPYTNIHIIGHSLGSHIAGFAGKRVQANVSETIARITGLDPAGPLFLMSDASERLSDTDALFVDAIHTDGNKYGYIYTIANADFYVNSGYAPQPGCLFYDAAGDMIACSHMRCNYLFAESIDSVKFVANICDNGWSYYFGMCTKNPKAVMGENVDLTAKGIYYLTSNSYSPYARNGKI